MRAAGRQGEPRTESSCGDRSSTRSIKPHGGEAEPARSWRRRQHARTRSIPERLEIIAAAQRRGLVGPAERVERVGGNPSGVLGSGLACTERLLVGGDCSLAQSQGLGRAADRDQQPGQIALPAIGVGVIGAERRLIDRERS
jgi:hypothetical protein